ncbi:MAG TPA: MotA/TolQ/ExbB proton channel family protein [Hyphomonadaceae bacterium]|nr:MotA/TolQ/ExbB proton channel family protein [Hyphomonadaceae bacterium]
MLRFPVMALLWVCVGFVLYFAAYSLVEAVRRQREHLGFNIKAWLQQGQVLAADEARKAVLPEGLRRMLAAMQQQNQQGALKHGGLENIVAEHEEQLRHQLDGPRALVKLGPSLGLIGTLIPMGSSLAAMAGGNLQAMAGQMVVAFTTTIIGLATGTVAYALVALRQGWVSTSIREQRYMAEVVAAELEQR